MKKIPLAIVANLYPTADKPYFGTFVKNISDNLDDDVFEKKNIVLPAYGTGAVGYLKFYFYCFLQMVTYNGVAYVHYVSHSVLPILFAKVFNRNLNLILNYHGSDAFSEDEESKFKKVLKRKICKLANKACDLIVVPSEYFKDRIKESYDIGRKPMFISPSGGFDRNVFYPFGTCEFKGSYRFLFASRMIAGKGCILAANAALLLSKSNPEASFTFVGDGPEQLKVRDILKDLIINGRCEIKPSMNQDDLAHEFRQSTFFLFPSMRKGESLGLVIVEAMACGSIPIAINQGALNEILDLDCEKLTTSKDDFIALVHRLNDESFVDLMEIRERLLLKAEKYERNMVMSSLSKEIYKTVRTK